MSRVPPIFPFVIGTNGAYAAVRSSPAQGSCGTKSYPCKHPGVDVVGRAGAVVRAPEDGTVVFAADGTASPFVGYGPWLVIVRGDSGKFHLFAHLDPADRQRAPIGLRVSAGQAVGITSAANHTHWEVRRKLIPDFAGGETNFTNNEDPIGWMKSGGTLAFLVIAGGGLLLWQLWRKRR